MDPAKKYLVALRDLPPQGKDFLVADRVIWTGPAEEFHMDCRFNDDPEMTVNILPTGEGWLLRGTVRGNITVPCSRCAKDTVLSIEQEFEDYVQQPDDSGELPENTLSEGDDHLIFDHGAVLMDLAAVAWEQFMLAVPPVPLCKPDCKGLCTICGKDLNTGPCDCDTNPGDPRLAVLRGLKLKKN